MLRTIQEGELRRVGENPSRRVDVRIVSATNRDLRQRGRGRAVSARFAVSPRRHSHRRSAAPRAREDIACSSSTLAGGDQRVSAVGRCSARATIAALARHDWPGTCGSCRTFWRRWWSAVRGAASCRRRRCRRTLPARCTVDPLALDEARRTFEERFVRAALVRSGGHRGRAADELGVTRQGLTKLMTRLGIAAETGP